MMHRKPLLTDTENKNVAFGGLFWIEMSTFIICSKIFTTGMRITGTYGHLNMGISYLHLQKMGRSSWGRLLVRQF